MPGSGYLSQQTNVSMKIRNSACHLGNIKVYRIESPEMSQMKTNSTPHSKNCAVLNDTRFLIFILTVFYFHWLQQPPTHTLWSMVLRLEIRATQCSNVTDPQVL